MRPSMVEAFANSLWLSLLVAAVGTVAGAILAYVIVTSRGDRLRHALTALADVCANFGGAPLAFAFIITLGSTGVITLLLKQAGIALYPGSFDPVSNGHLDVVRQAVGLCDKLIVAIGIHPGKKPLFTTEERLAMVRAVFGPVAAKDLNAQGIVTFAQIAALSDADVEKIDANMPFSADQIKDWREQAKELAKK